MQDSSSCSDDSVTLTDTATGIELFKFCGNQLPDDIMSSSNEMTVVFATDSSITTDGFVVSYVASSEVFGEHPWQCSMCVSVKGSECIGIYLYVYSVLI